jgi:hypothetical protein
MFFGCVLFDTLDTTRVMLEFAYKERGDKVSGKNQNLIFIPSVINRSTFDFFRR